MSETETKDTESTLEDKSIVTISNVDITQSTFWASNINDCTVTVDLDVPSGYKYSIHLSFKNALVEDDTFTKISPVIKNPFNSSEDIKQDTIIKNTKLTFELNNELFKNSPNGINTLRIEINDETPKEGTTGKSIYDYVITVENRNRFKIERKYSYKSEYLISGSGSITNKDGFMVKTSNGILNAMIVPKQPIEMDGRATIRTITVDATEDTSGECQKDIIVTMQEDEGDYIAQTIPLTEVLSFTSIDKVQAINANLLK